MQLALLLVLVSSVFGVLVSGRGLASDETYDTSFLSITTRTGARAWSCCRVCPQNHLLEIDQLFGSTPPPVRRYDDAQPAASTFLEMAAAVKAKGNNCCNVCATGQAANAGAGAPEALPPAGKRSSKEAIRAPLANLKFSLSRPPLPPCCPYCREEHQDEAFNLVVRPPRRQRGLPYRQRRDVYSGKSAFLEMETTVDAEADMEVDAEAEAEAAIKREYQYLAPTPDVCCNRCLRSPTDTEEGTSQGNNLWPDKEAPTEPDDEPGVIQQRMADKAAE